MSDLRTPSLFGAALRPLRSLTGGALIACAAALAAQPALAQSGATPPHADQQSHRQHKHHGHARGEGGAHHGAMTFGGSARHVERMLDAAGATEAQRTQIRQIMTTAAPSMKQLREQGRVLRERTQQVMTAPVIDANAAEQLRLQMVTHHDAVLKQRLAVMLDVAQQLSPEQRAKIGELMAQRKLRMQQRHERQQPATDAAKSNS